MTTGEPDALNAHSEVDAQSSPPVDALPADLAELRDLHATAMANLAAAEAAEDDAHSEWEAAQERWNATVTAAADADRAEEKARREYIDALRARGYVQTADGPKPAERA